MSSFYGNGGYSSGGGGGSGEVISVNGKKGRVTLDAADVHALPDSTQIPSLEGFATEAWVNNQDFLISEDISSKADKTDVTALDTRVTAVEGEVGALGNGSPTPVSTVAEMTDESTIYLYTGSETGYTAGNWYYYNGSAWTSGGTYGGAVTDTTLSISGRPADAKAVGDAIAAIEPGLSYDAKIALLDCFAHVAWTDAHGQNYYDALLNALNLPNVISSISAVFTQGSAVIYTDSSLNDLKPYLVVTANYSDSTTQTITGYTLSGTLTEGTSIITASYGGKTTTFNVIVSKRSATLQSITAVFTQGSTVIYTDSSLDDLKPHLVVTANYSDSTTATVTDYTLSGTLTEGTSVITVSYSGKTTTFNVTVSERPTLQSITATFTQGSAIIYENSSLNDLKQYLVVTATYSDSTTQTVTDYTLSGTLTAGTSTITVSYGGKTDTFNVTVSEVIADPIYALPEATTFNGTSNYIDTGLQLLTANKTNLTIVGDLLDKSKPTSGNIKMLFHCMHEVSPYPGITIQMNPATDTEKAFALNVNSNSASGGYESIRTTNIINDESEGIREKFAAIINNQNSTFTLVGVFNGKYFYKTTKLPSEYNSTEITEIAVIGARKKINDGTAQYDEYWKGTIYDLKIYDYSWDKTEADNYVKGGNS